MLLIGWYLTEVRSCSPLDHRLGQAGHGVEVWGPALQGVQQAGVVGRREQEGVQDHLVRGLPQPGLRGGDVGRQSRQLPELGEQVHPPLPPCSVTLERHTPKSRLLWELGKNRLHLDLGGLSADCFVWIGESVKGNKDGNGHLEQLGTGLCCFHILPLGDEMLQVLLGHLKVRHNIGGVRRQGRP